MAVVFAPLLLVSAGCTASAADVEPPRDELFFPTGIAVAPDESVAFVANSNSQLRYDSGTIDVLEMSTVTSMIQAWEANKTHGAGCEPDTDHRETLVCDEGLFIRKNAGVRTGNFATDLAVQDFGPGNYRVFSPNRGDPSIAWADYNGTALSCGTDNDSDFAQCDDAHRLTSVLEDPDMTNVADEPFGVYATAGADGKGYAIVTHQTNGVVTLIDAPKTNMGTVAITDIKYNVFSPDLLTGVRGATGVTGRKTASGADIVYVGSRTDARIAEFTINPGTTGVASALLYTNYFYLDGVGTDAGVGGSGDTRGMTVSADGNELYLVNRFPPSLQVYDTSVDATGGLQNKLLTASDICREASNVAAIDLGPELGTRVFITCFSEGTVYVVDPRGVSQLADVIQSGRGPFAVAAAPNAKLVFVTNFLEDTISVIDVSPTSAMQNRVVLRIGTPKPLEST